MRIGLISDVHGNLPALEAVLADLELQAVDRTICLGDLASGPWPGETVRRLAALEPACVVGNWDAWILDGVAPCDNGETGSKLLALGSFWAEQLDDADRAFMRSAESRLELDADGGSLLFVHGSPRSYNEPILATTPAEELARMLGDPAPRVLVVGHTHVQMLRRLPETVIVNPGSVGLPFLEWPARDARVGRWSEYGVLDYRGSDSVTVELHRVAYDADAVLRHTLASGAPYADWWVDCWEGP